MRLYDAILLLRARWRWFVVLPAFSMSVTIVALLLMSPRDFVAHAVVRVDSSLPAVRVQALLSSRTLAERIGATTRLTVEPGKGERLEVIAQAATQQQAIRTATAAIDTVNDDEARRHLSELLRLLADQAALRKRTDRFAVIEYQALTPRIERLRNGAPRGEALEVIEPVVVTQLPALRPYPVVASGLSALAVVFVAVFVQAWWLAERALRKPEERT